MKCRVLGSLLWVVAWGAGCGVPAYAQSEGLEAREAWERATLEDYHEPGGRNTTTLDGEDDDPDADAQGADRQAGTARDVAPQRGEPAAVDEGYFATPTPDGPQAGIAQGPQPQPTTPFEVHSHLGWCVVGSVLNTHALESPGGVEHAYARLRVSDGSKLTVDLGPSALWKGIAVQPGQELRVQGPLAPIVGRRVLRAHVVLFDGGAVHVEAAHADASGAPGSVAASAPREEPEDGPAARRPAEADAAAPRIAFTGVLLESRAITSQADGAKHTLVRFELRDGGQRIVDLGPGALLPAELAVGDRLQVRGALAALNGRAIVVLDELRLMSGERVTVGPASEAGR